MLKFNPDEGIIRDHEGFPVAYVSRIAHERWPEIGKQLALGPETAVALKRCVEAMDTLFAMLVESTHNGGGMDPFFPSKSGEPWEAMRAAHDLIKRVEAG
jgi:hypothetical protein